MTLCTVANNLCRSLLDLLNKKMKLTCVILVMVAFLAMLVPLAECRPTLDVGGLGESLDQAKMGMSTGLQGCSGQECARHPVSLFPIPRRGLLGILFPWY